MPDIAPKNPIRWVSVTKDFENKDTISLHVGPTGEKVAKAMNSAIAAYANQGLNIIVDSISYRNDWLSDLEQKLASHKKYL